jgi:glutathione S-transferase
MTNEMGARQRILHGIGTTRTLRAHWALHELGLDYQTEPVLSRSGQTETAEYRRLDPRGKIPVLDDGGFIVTESAAIVTYLGERYGTETTPLVPRDLESRTRYNEWLSFTTMELDATSLYVIRRHEGLPHIYGEAPTATRVAREYFLRQIDAAAAKMTDGRPSLIGDTFTGADIVMTTCLAWADGLELPLPTVFRAYLARQEARPAFASALAANTPADAS